jgi:hypothetical protein
MGVAFKERSIHEGPRVTLIGITDDIFLFAWGTPAKFPFLTGGKTSSTPPP